MIKQYNRLSIDELGCLKNGNLKSILIITLIHVLINLKDEYYAHQFNN